MHWIYSNLYSESNVYYIYIGIMNLQFHRNICYICNRTSHTINPMYTGFILSPILRMQFVLWINVCYIYTRITLSPKKNIYCKRIYLELFLLQQFNSLDYLQISSQVNWQPKFYLSWLYKLIRLTYSKLFLLQQFLYSLDYLQTSHQTNLGKTR